MAIRIPRGLAEDARLSDGTDVEFGLEDGRLTVRPVAPAEPALEALLARITPENVHGEECADGARGAEAW